MITLKETVDSRSTYFIMATGTRRYEGIDIKLIIPDTTEAQAKSAFENFLAAQDDNKSYLLTKVIADTHPPD